MNKAPTLGLRRFNALFRSNYRLTPTDLRRQRAAQPASMLTLSLDYRPPFDWDSLLAFFHGRAVPQVEQVADGRYRRCVRGGSPTSPGVKPDGMLARQRVPSGSAVIANDLLVPSMSTLTEVALVTSAWTPTGG